MDNIIPYKIQALSIIGSLIFLAVIARLIIKGKLREEYSIIWIVCTLFLVLFSVWRNGLDVIAKALGVFYAPSLIFLFGFFAIIIFLVHLSVVNSKQQKNITELSQELALLKKKLDKKDEPD